ncbi:MAG: ABC transporter, partial [Gammaproteobacteria bacterium]|nr:ABC transporter [Gammaproteobacteria bacterium]NIT63072.1 ABC transporter [Gammaproteobacteria bacterium]NIV20031.1 ABC transporter [Gammaproteobacteria bacterium]NIY31652.1 ABC transporter [Gammaproteobacteria bacterium]
PTGWQTRGCATSERPPVLKRFLRQPQAVLSLLVLLAFALGAAFAPLLAPYPPDAVNPRDMLEPPGNEHVMG